LLAYAAFWLLLYSSYYYYFRQTAKQAQWR